MNFINTLLPHIENLGVWGYWLVFGVALFESLAFVGAILPGATIVVFSGFLSAQGYLDFGDLIWFAAIGAIVGDSLSYYLGTKGTQLFKNENKFLKEHHIDAGNAYFKKHGNKSIFFARFISFLRPIVPFVAGLTKMDFGPFIFWNVLSGFLWAILHITLGYFFGGALGVVVKWTGRISLFFLIVILIILVWIFIKKIRKKCTTSILCGHNTVQSMTSDTTDQEYN
jgi:membrane protein DedA with SNARE-associated domain